MPPATTTSEQQQQQQQQQPPPSPALSHVSTASIMDQGQDTLPRLPVPTLADTFERYLASVKALSTSDAEYERTAKLVAEFLAPGGRGEQLQERLKRHAAACSSTSWLEDIWNEYAYFSNRESVCFYVNYCFGFRDDNRNQTQLSRAAVMVDAALDFRDAIITRELEPDYLRANPVCMFQYNHLFNCSRYPRKPLDATIKHSYENNHIVVARKGYYFVFDTVHKNTQERLTVPEIYRQLERIIAMADEIEAAAAKGSAPAGKKVGILTTQHRDVWADDRDSLLAVSVANRASLLKLESAVFMLCLDEASPESREEFSRACWHGDGKNRYFDKCFQLIVFKNGRAGFNGEHSLTDGTTSWRLAGHIIRRAENDPVYVPPTPQQIQQYLQQQKDQQTGNGQLYVQQQNNNGRNGGVRSRTSSMASMASVASDHSTNSIYIPDDTKLPPIEPLKFDADEKVQEALDRAEAKFNEEAAAHQVGVLEFADFGKALIKRWRVSPDAFVQMAIQLAYYRQFGQFKATYESAATKKFAHGRTETVRSVSQESVKWVKAMANYTNSTSDKQASQEKVDMLRKGIETHSKSTLLCVDGRGIDRHMLGLRWMVAKDAGEEMPEVFTDPNFSASCHWTLSTSQISDEIFEEYGWGEVVEDGFGIAYMIKERSLHFNVASKGMGSHDMCWQLGRALRDMYVLFESTKSSATVGVGVAIPLGISSRSHLLAGGYPGAIRPDAKPRRKSSATALLPPAALADGEDKDGDAATTPGKVLPGLAYKDSALPAYGYDADFYGGEESKGANSLAASVKKLDIVENSWDGDWVGMGYKPVAAVTTAGATAAATTTGADGASVKSDKDSSSTKSPNWKNKVTSWLKK